MTDVSLVELIIFVAVIGVAVYLFNLLVALPPNFKQAINVVAGVVIFVAILVWILGFFGFGSGDEIVVD